MIYQTPYYSIVGLILLFLWTLNFWSIFKKPLLSFKVKHRSISFIRSSIKKIIYLIGASGLLLISYSLMNPSISVGEQKGNIDVKDIYFVVDVSQSMLSIDFKPNRLEVAKNKIRDFIELRPTDRIGIVIFSDNVFTLMPLTIDNKLVLKAVDEVSVGYLGSGTNIGDALMLALGRLKKSKVKNKFIILLTDGVSNTGMLTPIEAAKMAKEYKIKIYSIGIGKIKNGNYLQNGAMGYRNIPGGSVDLEVMKKISKSTDGKFFYAGNSRSLKRIFSEIQKLEKTQIKSMNNNIYSSLYYKFLLLGSALFLLCEILRRLILKEVM